MWGRSGACARGGLWPTPRTGWPSPEEQLEEARVVATSAARTQRTETIERGERVVQAELPRLIAQLRGAQQAMLAFAERMAELDRPLEGGRYFQEATWVPLLPQQGLDFWVEWVTATFKLERR